MSDREERARFRAIASQLTQVPHKLLMKLWIQLLEDGCGSPEIIAQLSHCARSCPRVLYELVDAHPRSILKYPNELAGLLGAYGCWCKLSCAEKRGLCSLLCNRVDLKREEVQRALTYLAGGSGNVYSYSSMCSTVISDNIECFVSLFTSPEVCIDGLANLCADAVAEDDSIFLDIGDPATTLFVSKLCSRLESLPTEHAVSVWWERVIVSLVRYVPLDRLHNLCKGRVSILHGALLFHVNEVDAFQWLDCVTWVEALSAAAVSPSKIACHCLVMMAERGLTRALASPKMAPHVLAVAKQSLRSLGSDRVLCYTLSDAPWAISAMLKLTSQTPLQFSESFRGYTGLVALNAAVTSEWHAVSSLCKNDVLAFVQAHEKFGEIAAECLLGLAHMDTEYFKLLANRGVAPRPAELARSGRSRRRDVHAPGTARRSHDQNARPRCGAATSSRRRTFGEPVQPCREGALPRGTCGSLRRVVGPRGVHIAPGKAGNCIEHGFPRDFHRRLHHKQGCFETRWHDRGNARRRRV